MVVVGGVGVVVELHLDERADVKQLHAPNDEKIHEYHVETHTTRNSGQQRSSRKRTKIKRAKQEKRSGDQTRGILGVGMC